MTRREYRPAESSSERPQGRLRDAGSTAGGRPLRPLERLGVALAVGAGRLGVHLLGATLRLAESNRDVVERLWAAGSPVIYTTWHGRMLMFPYFYGRLRCVHVLASRSRDGELVSRLARAFGFQAVRGSSSRGATAALRALARLLREERAEVAVVPDGPRGPRHVAQPGVVLLAKLGHAPIVPLGFGASRATVLETWDAFHLPHPFARVAVVFGEPLLVPADADRETLEAARQQLEATLHRVTAEAERLARAAAGSRSRVESPSE
jgi:lysophospholipid acyltransferase (LPLAT)-like uncharacterized protein